MIMKQLYFKIATILCVFLFLSCVKEEDKNKCSFVGYGVIIDKFSRDGYLGEGIFYSEYYAVINNDTIGASGITHRKLVKGNTFLYKKDGIIGDSLLIFKDWKGRNFYASISEKANKNAVIDYEVRTHIVTWWEVIIFLVVFILFSAGLFFGFVIIFGYIHNDCKAKVSFILFVILYIILLAFTIHLVNSQNEKLDNMPIIISSK
jgi:hypothetical protein